MSEKLDNAYQALKLWKEAPTEALVVPVVNINGTAKGELVQALAIVMHNFGHLKESWVRATPHGRDYQVGADAETINKNTKQARDAWLQRYALLQVLFNEVEALAEAINEQ